mgnify:CR=1 FL=1
MIDEDFDISVYFSPIDLDGLDFFSLESDDRIGNRIAVHTLNHFPDMSAVKIVILGVEEERNELDNKGCAEAPNAIRKQFYQLYHQSNMPAIADIGNLKIGNKIKDTYIILTDILSFLIQNDICPIVLGGSQDLTYAVYLAYQQLDRVINITAIDSRLDLGKEDEPIKANAYLNKIILSQPNCLFNYSNIGYQSYFVDNKELALMDKLLFDTYRLGMAKQDLVDIEPIIRNADMVTIDMSAVRFADSPGCKQATPNGFSGEEMCTLAHYAGANNKLSSFGIYEYNPSLDIRNQSAILIAEMIWYFVQGYVQRSNDLPDIAKGNFFKYYVSLFDNTYKLIFYKSKTSHLWWMEIPIEEGKNAKFSRNYIIPCSEKDYRTACQEEMPERWLQTYKKIKP